MIFKVLRIAVEESGVWYWSKAFTVSSDGSLVVEFTTNSLLDPILISVNVSSLSATQKLVEFVGQFIISNQLADSFEMKLVKYDPNNVATAAAAGGKVGGQIVGKDLFQIPPSSSQQHSPSSSIVFVENNNVAMRLRFSSVNNNLSWTGDIPLQPNTRWGQPWLVKGYSHFIFHLV